MDPIRLRAIARAIANQGFDASVSGQVVVIRMLPGDPPELLRLEELIDRIRARISELSLHVEVRDPEEVGPWVYLLY